jgi:hypothetical protein
MCKNPECDQQIRNAQLVDTSSAGQSLQFFTRHPNQRSGRLTDIHCIQYQQVGTVPDVGKQFQAQRTALNQRDIPRHSRIASKFLYGLRANTIVRVEGVAQAEHNAGCWRRHSVRLTQNRIFFFFFQFGLRNKLVAGEDALD